MAGNRSNHVGSKPAARSIPISGVAAKAWEFYPPNSRKVGLDPYRSDKDHVAGADALDGDRTHRKRFLQKQISTPPTRLSTTHASSVNTIFCGGPLTPNVEFQDTRRVGNLVQVGCSTLIYNDHDYRVDRTSSNNSVISVLSALEVLAQQDQQSARVFVGKLPPHIRTHPEFIRAFSFQFAYSDNTRKTYWCSFRQMRTFFHSLWPPSPGIMEWEYLASIPLDQALNAWLMQRSIKGTAASCVSKWFDSLVFVCKYYKIDTTFDNDQTRNMIAACKKVFGKAPKATFALNRKLLRYLFDFLREQDLISYRFFLLNFLCANRASEAVKIHKDNVCFHEDHEQRPYVTILIPNTKTQNKAIDDGKKLTFYKLRPRNGQTAFVFDPYTLIKYFYDLAHLTDGWLCPFQGPSAPARRRKLYHWFKSMKKAFAAWLKATLDIDVDTSNWRFHSIRTTYIGIMRKCGLSWEQIQLRTAHQIDSKCTRNTYFMNALLSEGFDNEFEKLLEENADLQQLFGPQKSGDLDDTSDEFYLTPIDTDEFARFINDPTFRAYADAKAQRPLRSQRSAPPLTNEKRAYNRMNIPSRNATRGISKPQPLNEDPYGSHQNGEPMDTSSPSPLRMTIDEDRLSSPTTGRPALTAPRSSRPGSTLENNMPMAVPVNTFDVSTLTPSRPVPVDSAATEPSGNSLIPHARTTADQVGISPFTDRPSRRRRIGTYAYRDPTDFREDEYIPPYILPFSPPVSTPKRKEAELQPPRALRFVDEPLPRPPSWLLTPVTTSPGRYSNSGTRPPKRQRTITPLETQLKRL